MKLKYIKTGDYELPNLTLNDNKKGTINKYGMLRLDYLKQHKKVLYTTLLMKDELTNHLISVSKNAENLLNNLMESYRKYDKKLSEKSKETNQIEWIKLMNNYKNTAEEILVRTHIFCLASTEFVLPYKFYMGIPIPLNF